MHEQAHNRDLLAGTTSNGPIKKGLPKNAFSFKCVPRQLVYTKYVQLEVPRHSAGYAKCKLKVPSFRGGSFYRHSPWDFVNGFEIEL